MLSLDGVSKVERERLESRGLGSSRTSGRETSVGPLQESGTTSGRGVADGNGPTAALSLQWVELKYSSMINQILAKEVLKLMHSLQKHGIQSNSKVQGDQHIAI